MSCVGFIFDCCVLLLWQLAACEFNFTARYVGMLMTLVKDSINRIEAVIVLSCPLRTSHFFTQTLSFACLGFDSKKRRIRYLMGHETHSNPLMCMSVSHRP
eukprot:COSAG05_NODE_825_length_7106_cov_74.690881_7_plen_101_part_00